MASWENVGNITGPEGPEGPEGPRGPEGPKGDKGDQGNPFVIRGSLDSESELPSDGVPGEAYLINGNLYVFQ